MYFKSLTCCLVVSQLRKSYGNVYSMFLGSQPVIIINGLKTIKEAMVTKGIDFAGRPQDMFVTHTARRKGQTEASGNQVDLGRVFSILCLSKDIV